LVFFEVIYDYFSLFEDSSWFLIVFVDSNESSVLAKNLEFQTDRSDGACLWVWVHWFGNQSQNLLLGTDLEEIVSVWKLASVFEGPFLGDAPSSDWAGFSREVQVGRLMFSFSLNQEESNGLALVDGELNSDSISFVRGAHLGCAFHLEQALVVGGELCFSESVNDLSLQIFVLDNQAAGAESNLGHLLH
jgi:hypothetical protein